MKRRHDPTDFNPESYSELKIRTAIHEAGHAAAIYFGNQQKQLPPVFFSIYIDRVEANSSTAVPLCKKPGAFYSKIKGGRLIHTLPVSFNEAIRFLSPQQVSDYKMAFEADIFNLLVGPLAEAYYVAQRDNERITPRLVSLPAMSNYGGSSDLEYIYQYLECLTHDEIQRQEKITELFLAAFRFIMHSTHWMAITALANCILTTDKNLMDNLEIVAVFDKYTSYSMLTGF